MDSTVHGVTESRTLLSLSDKTHENLFLEEGNGNPFQYSCLEKPMDRGAWWATVHDIAKSQTRLSDFTLSLYSISIIRSPLKARKLNHPSPQFIFLRQEQR